MRFAVPALVSGRKRLRGESAEKGLLDVLLVGPLEHLDRGSIGIPPCPFLGTTKRGDRFNGHHQIDQLLKGNQKMTQSI